MKGSGAVQGVLAVDVVFLPLEPRTKRIRDLIPGDLRQIGGQSGGTVKPLLVRLRSEEGGPDVLYEVERIELGP